MIFVVNCRRNFPFRFVSHLSLSYPDDVERSEILNGQLISANCSAIFIFWINEVCKEKTDRLVSFAARRIFYTSRALLQTRPQRGAKRSKIAFIQTRDAQMKFEQSRYNGYDDQGQHLYFDYHQGRVIAKHSRANQQTLSPCRETLTL